MDSEIEFGQVEHSEPETGPRPDEDKYFAVVECGTVRDQDLPIFVDLDVLRDMEAHARENTRVELGGVLLGRQLIDRGGKPFVLVTDSLRAKHYEATKGSFKFTHETWNQITRERNEFRDDLEMIGWYHTHPGWGVFLSGMDLFICNNFFNRPLDVALVIDPCAGDRGWFQWSDAGQTVQTGGFFLVSNRHRQRELLHFQDQVNQSGAEFADPRFRQAPFSQSSQFVGETMVNVIDNRRPLFELAIVATLFFQLLMVGILGWRMLQPGVDRETANTVVGLAALEEAERKQMSAELRSEIYGQLLDQVLINQTGESGVAEKLVELTEQNVKLDENVAGQIARVKLFESEKNSLAYELANEKNLRESAESDLRRVREELAESRNKFEALEEKNPDDPSDTLLAGLPNWLIYSVTGTVVFLFGLIAGGYFANLRQKSHLFNNPQQENEDQDSETPLEKSELRSI